MKFRRFRVKERRHSQKKSQKVINIAKKKMKFRRFRVKERRHSQKKKPESYKYCEKKNENSDDFVLRSVVIHKKK